MTLEDMKIWRDVFARAVRFVVTKEIGKPVFHLETQGMLTAAGICTLLRDAFDEIIKETTENKP